MNYWNDWFQLEFEFKMALYWILILKLLANILCSLLDGTVGFADQGAVMFQYYIKIVPTTYSRTDGSVFLTNQFSVTRHQVIGLIRVKFYALNETLSILDPQLKYHMKNHASY